MTEHHHWFSTFQDVPSRTWSVVVADDRDLWVRGIGDINITRLVDGIHKRGVLKKVLYIPDLRRNLFSIGLVSKAGLSFQTLGDKCVLYVDLGHNRKVLEGNQVGTLYRLSISHVPPTLVSDTQTEDQHMSTAFATSTIFRNTDLVLWHNRMAHVSIHTIKNMSAHGNVKDLPVLFNSRPLQVCTGCALGKQHKSTYDSNSQKERSKIPGKLLHADLGGKMSTPSLGQAHYYILIKDDCTSFRFVAFLKTKEDAIRFFIKVLRSIENVTGNSVKTLRTDHGTEFCNTKFDLLFREKALNERQVHRDPST